MSTNTILATTPLVSTNYLLRATGTTIGNSLIWDNGTNVGIGNTNTSYTLDVTGTGRFTSTLLVSGAATFSSNVSLALTKSLFVYSTTYGIGTPDSSGLQIFTETGDAIRLGHRTSGGVFTDRLFINSAGNVGIGTSSPSAKFMVLSADNTSATNIARFAANNDTLAIGIGYESIRQTETGGVIKFETNATERMRITSGGFVGINVAPIYTFHAKSTVINDWSASIENGVTYTGLPIYGLLTTFATSPNSSSSYFYYAADSTTQRFSVRGNGGIYNFQANDSNLSDIRTKKDIIPLESYWDKFKAIEIVKFKYIDQTHDDFNIGVIAQQVEEIAPEFVDTDYWENPINENKTEMKSVFTTDLYHAAIKVLQEAMTKIEELSAKNEELSNRLIKLESK